MIAFSETHSPLVKFYNTFIRENKFYHRLPRLKIHNHKYFYTWLKFVYQRQFPWEFVKEGQTVIQVSTAKALISQGISQALILLTLVGPKGRVIVIEPDPSNACVFKAYLITQGIKNVTVIEKGVWKEKGCVDFSVRPGFSSWNRIRETIEPDVHKNYEHKIASVEVEVDTLDHIIAENHIDNVSFINMTINGGEYPALLGMTETLKHNITFCFPIQNASTVKSPILSKLEEVGFNIMLKHAPVAMHQKQFIVACAVKKSPEAILVDGYEEVELALAQKNDREFILIKSKTGNKKYDDWVFRKQVSWF